MSDTINEELLDYFHHYCELTIWFKKIILQSGAHTPITIKDILDEFVAERNRILLHLARAERKRLKPTLNKVIKGYCSKVANWSRTQRITPDMV